MAVFYGTPNVKPVYLRILFTTHHVFDLVNFDPLHMLSHNSIALIQVIFSLNEPTWIKLSRLHLDIKYSLIILLGINMPWPPNILHHFGMFDWVLQNWVLRVKILMIHSNYDVFAVGSASVWVVDHYLVVAWCKER